MEAHAAWLARTRTTVQDLGADLAAADACELSALVGRGVAAMEPAPDHLHGALLSLLLMRVSWQIVQTLHDRGPLDPCTCAATSWSHVGGLTEWCERDPRRAFREWTDAFLAHFAREHPPTPGARAAALVRADPIKTWTMTALARAVATGPLRLRQEFQTCFGMRPSAYLQLVRATRAVRLLHAATKVEAVAWDVGYRSKKDLYAALKRWVGATPTELRSLSDVERQWLERELRIRCLGGPRRTRTDMPIRVAGFSGSWRPYGPGRG